MPLSAPTSPELRAVAGELGFSFTDADLEIFRGDPRRFDMELRPCP